VSLFLLGGPVSLMNSGMQTKTIKVAMYPDGSRFVLRKERGAWWYRRGEGAFPLSAAIKNVEELGGAVVTEPNPSYRPPAMFSLR